MDLRRITDDYSVAPQIEVDEVEQISTAGFRSIMCNRPDAEELGQVEFNAIAEAAAQAGLETRWVPVVSGALTREALDQFREALDEMPKPLLAYCRSGTRCTILWAISQHGSMDDGEIIQKAADAGYDVAGIIRQLSGS